MSSFGCLAGNGCTYLLATALLDVTIYSTDWCQDYTSCAASPETHREIFWTAQQAHHTRGPFMSLSRMTFRSTDCPDLEISVMACCTSRREKPMVATSSISCTDPVISAALPILRAAQTLAKCIVSWMASSVSGCCSREQHDKGMMVTQACGGISQPLRQTFPTLHAHLSACSSTRTALAHNSDTATTGPLQLGKCTCARICTAHHVHLCGNASWRHATIRDEPCRERQLQSWIPSGQGALIYCPQARVVDTCPPQGDRRILQEGWAGAGAAAVGTCTWQCILSQGTSAKAPLVNTWVARLRPLIAITLWPYYTLHGDNVRPGNLQTVGGSFHTHAVHNTLGTWLEAAPHRHHAHRDCSGSWAWLSRNAAYPWWDP